MCNHKIKTPKNTNIKLVAFAKIISEVIKTVRESPNSIFLNVRNILLNLDKENIAPVKINIKNSFGNRLISLF